jgi:phosphonate transport system substrate-binding protein
MHLDQDGNVLRRDLGRVLTEALGAPVKVQAEPNYAALAARVAARDATIAWLPPALFVRAWDEQRVARVLRVARSKSGAYQGAIFARADGPIRSPRDLSGKRIAWVDRESSAGYLFPRLALTELGLDVGRLFAHEVFVKSHARSVRAVLEGHADAGATFVQLEDPSDPARGIAITGWTGFTQTKTLHAVLVSGSIPSDSICVLAGAPEPDRIAAALGELHTRPNGARLYRQLLNGDRLVPADPADYEPVRRALAT